MMRLTIPLTLLGSTAALALDPLPSGHGLAAQHGAALARHPAVLFTEDFEAGTLPAIKQRWNEASDDGERVLALVRDHPPGSPGRQCLQVTATLGENTGGHLFKRLDPVQTRVFARFHVKFADDAPYVHHFSGLGGYNPPTNWPQGGAGTHARGDQRFSARIEPNGDYGRIAAPGAWFLYTYWNDMKSSADGRYWGNGLWPEKPHSPPKGRWQCVELMLRCNDVGTSNGELALWLDGTLVMHIAPGTRHTNWSGEGFHVAADGKHTFEGFRWRTVPELAISYFSLSHYVTENAYAQNRVSNPPKINRVWFDDVVVATEYIGPHP